MDKHNGSDGHTYANPRRPGEQQLVKEVHRREFHRRESFCWIGTAMEGFRDVFDAEDVPKVSFTCGAKRFCEISIQPVTRRHVL